MLCWLICFFLFLILLESIHPCGLFSTSTLPWPNLSSSSPPCHVFCYSVGLYIFVYLHRGAALQGMTQMFENRRAWLVRGSHKPLRQWLPRFSSPFRFLLFSLLSDFCLQELRGCSCDFYFFLCAGLVTVMHEPKNWIIFPWRKSARY